MLQIFRPRWNHVNLNTADKLNLRISHEVSWFWAQDGVSPRSIEDYHGVQQERIAFQGFDKDVNSGVIPEKWLKRAWSMPTRVLGFETCTISLSRKKSGGVDEASNGW